MKYTLLEIVSDILSDMDGDFVSSINDTDEALQVAQIVKTAYQAIMSNRNWTTAARVLNITPYADNTLPTHTRIEDNVKEIISVYYDKAGFNDNRLNYQPIRYLDPDDFLRHINQRNSLDVNSIVVLDPSGVKLIISTNKAPEYYTSFDETTMVFDSFDASVDSTIQASKTQIRAYIIPTFEMQDDFVPDLPDEGFSLLIEESKSKAMFKIKQVQDIKAEQEAGRQNRWLSRKNWRAHEQDLYPYNYGRGRHGGHGRRKDPTFRRP